MGWGLTIDTVSCTNIIISIGLCVEERTGTRSSCRHWSSRVQRRLLHLSRLHPPRQLQVPRLLHLLQGFLPRHAQPGGASRIQPALKRGGGEGGEGGEGGFCD